MNFKTETSAGGIVYRKIRSRFGDRDEIRNLLWLITQHSLHKGWGFPKGLIGDNNKNEKMKDAALREVEEEGGVKAKIVNDRPVKVEYKYSFQDTQVDKTVYYFLMEYISGDPKDHDWEMMDAKFVTEEEIKKTLTYKSDQEAFEKILLLKS